MINLCDILLWFDLLAHMCALSNVTPKGILFAICSDIVNVFKKKVLIIRDLLWPMCIPKGQTGKFKFLERFFSNFKHCRFFEYFFFTWNTACLLDETVHLPVHLVRFIIQSTGSSSISAVNDIYGHHLISCHGKGQLNHSTPRSCSKT